MDQLNHYFALHQSIIVPSGYFNFTFGTNPDEILKDKEGIKGVRRLANNMIYILKMIDISKTQGLKFPNTYF